MSSAFESMSCNCSGGCEGCFLLGVVLNVFEKNDFMLLGGGFDSTSTGAEGRGSPYSYVEGKRNLLIAHHRNARTASDRPSAGPFSASQV